MAEEIDLRFLGEQIRRLQGDVRQVKSDMAEMRTDVGGDLVAVRASWTHFVSRSTIGLSSRSN